VGAGHVESGRRRDRDANEDGRHAAALPAGHADRSVDPAALPAHHVPPEHRLADPAVDVDDDEDEPVRSTASSDDDVPFTPTAAEGEAEPVYHITKVMRRKGGGFYLLTKETGDQPLFTENESLATAAHRAIEKSQSAKLFLERRGADTWVVEMSVAVNAGAGTRGTDDGPPSLRSHRRLPRGPGPTQRGQVRGARPDHRPGAGATRMPASSGRGVWPGDLNDARMTIEDRNALVERLTAPGGPWRRGVIC
jgi:hypothetical protein